MRGYCMNGFFIPKATLGRLPQYLEFLRNLPSDAPETISATTIARNLSLGEVQVRKDLAIVSGAGKPKIGYITRDLIRDLEHWLGSDEFTSAVIVGAGKLGSALYDYSGFEEYGVNFEHLPTGIDTMCVVVHEKELNPHRDDVIRRICELVNPDQVTVHDHLALIATVGRGMVRNFGTAARLFTAISSQGISIRTIDQGSSELNIIVGVDEDDFENAVKAIYDTFVRT